MKNYKYYILVFIYCMSFAVYSQQKTYDSNVYNPTWLTQSKGSHESMPCGGGDIGLNVWVENNDILFYISRSGAFDENNTLLKAGRVRVKLFPNPFNDSDFKQVLNLSKGNVEINGGKTKVQIWVDINNPLIHVEVDSPDKIETEVYYENWRYQDRIVRKHEANQNSYKWAIPDGLTTKKDIVDVANNEIIFYHKNESPNIFDVVVEQQGMSSVKDELFNPVKDLISGGKLWGNNLVYDDSGLDKYVDTDYKYWKFKSKKSAKSHRIYVALHNKQVSDENVWKSELDEVSKGVSNNKSKQITQKWWSDFQKRSFISINKNSKESEPWKIGRNYQLFRYMLGCNSKGGYPTKFNGGLFAFDPSFVDSTFVFTPDFRKWGGGTFTAQNQRLVYFPMLKSGDFELMKPQFDFYANILRNAELRSNVYWGHGGACFTEQMENFGLPNPSEYGWKRPDFFDKGIEYNAWLEYQWDTVLEFCHMILETNRYNKSDISEYIPFIESSLIFFDEHYTHLAKMRGRKTLDDNGHLILYPGTALETYKMAYNATSTISSLKGVLEGLIDYYSGHAEREKWESMYSRIPSISYAEIDGKKTIAPAKMWERLNNVEVPQLYPVFPWRKIGVGKENVEIGINTYKLDPDALKFRSHVGWKQDNIFAACLGLTDEAKRLTLLKLADGPFRYPAFWGPGFDWTPDHNWGGSGMIGLQEMLVQTDDEKIYLFPAWPKEWDVHFKLHVANGTVIEAELVNGKAEIINVTPAERSKDIINMINN